MQSAYRKNQGCNAVFAAFKLQAVLLCHGSTISYIPGQACKSKYM